MFTWEMVALAFALVFVAHIFALLYIARGKSWIFSVTLGLSVASVDVGFVGLVSGLYDYFANKPANLINLAAAIVSLLLVILGGQVFVVVWKRRS